MNTVVKNSLLLLLAFYICGGCNLSGQNLMKKISLREQVDNASLVVEGKVIEKKCVWDTEHKSIYTINTVKVYKVFKGKSASTINIITKGGVIGLEALMVNPSLKLQKDDVGIFTLVNNTSSIPNTGKSQLKNFKSYGASQGFYKYNLKEDVAVNSFYKKKGIGSNFYNEIQQYTKKEFKTKQLFSAKNKILKSISNKNTLAPSTLTLNKTVATAGTKDMLIITGTDFGTTKGGVFFRNSDDGGATFVKALDTQVISWTNTRIAVEIPYLAGSGSIFIEDGTGAQSPLSPNLIISYSEINVDFDNDDDGPEPTFAYPIQHYNQSGTGGYIWEMHTDFFNNTEIPGAKVAFERAFNKWVEETGIHWTISNSPSNTDSSGNEKINIIRFDNGNELDTGVLGVCETWLEGCENIAEGTLNWYVADLDITFDDSGNWYTGIGTPATDQIDFESVALHELGHGHLLGHVIDPILDGNNLDDIMKSASFSGETQRTLNNNNITIANNIQTRGVSSSVCGNEAMLPFDPNFEPVLPNDNSDNIDIFPNPTAEELFIKNNTARNLTKIEIYDIRGRLVFSKNFSMAEEETTKSFNIANVSQGLYLLKIYANDSLLKSQKIIKN